MGLSTAKPKRDPSKLCFEWWTIPPLPFASRICLAFWCPGSCRTFSWGKSASSGPKLVFPFCVLCTRTRQVSGLTEDPRARECYLWRGAQLKSGMLNRRSVEDEFFVSIMHNPLKFSVARSLMTGFSAVQGDHQHIKQFAISEALQCNQAQSNAVLENEG